LKFKIRTLLLLAMIAIIVLPLFTISLFYNTGIRDLYEARCRSYGHEIIKQAGENINTLITQVKYTEKRLTSSVRTSRILLGYSDQWPLRKLDVINDIERMIWNYKQSASFISDIYLFGYDNHLFSTTTTTDLEKLKNAPWIYELTEPHDQGLVTATHKAYYDIPESMLSVSQKNKYVISFVQKVYHLGLNDEYSILQMDIKYSEIERIMNSIDLGARGYALIYNDKNEIIYCENKEYLGRPLEAYQNGGDAEGMADGIVQTEYLLDTINWRVRGYVSTEAIDKEFSQMNRVFLMAIFFSLIGAIFLTIILTQQITKPITWLTQQMRKVGRGDFSISSQNIVCEEFSCLSEQFGKMVNEIDELLRITQEQEKERAAAEFQALQNQINPHFLYNTLNILKWMALMNNNAEIAQAIVSLVKMMKFTYSDNGDYIPISSEISFLKDYVAIQKLRYGNGIEVVFDIDPNLYQYSILKFILQPIVENAFVHAFSENRSDQRIIIEGKIEDRSLIFTVKDNGVGIDTRKSSHYSGLGIRNVEQRIKIHFGGDYGIKVCGRPNEGTTVTITLPLIDEDVPA
jgi:two-component system sensor histidine kinase YesM